MIYYFSNYFALLAAIYFTMCLDKILTQRIWSNDYFDNFSNTICQSSTIAESIAGNIITNSKKDVNDMQDMLIRKSVYMLSLVAMILVYCGVEQDTCIKSEELECMHVAISGASMISFLTFNVFFSKFVYTKWWCTILAIGINVVLYGFLGNFGQLFPTSIFYYLEEYSSLILVVFFTLPIMWQIWECIVYKAFYPSYIDKAIKRIGADYQKAQDGIERGDSSQIPKKYRTVFDLHTLKDKSRTVQEVIDSSMDEYVEVLQNDIQKAGININAHQIVFRLIKYYILDCISCFKDHLVRDKIAAPTRAIEEIIERETIVSYGYDALQKEYEDSGVSMDDFCINKGINKKDFQIYIKRKKK